jgi:hypothetical protein
MTPWPLLNRDPGGPGITQLLAGAGPRPILPTARSPAGQGNAPTLPKGDCGCKGGWSGGIGASSDHSDAAEVGVLGDKHLILVWVVPIAAAWRPP